MRYEVIEMRYEMRYEVIGLRYGMRYEVIGMSYHGIPSIKWIWSGLLSKLLKNSTGSEELVIFTAAISTLLKRTDTVHDRKRTDR